MGNWKQQENGLAGTDEMEGEKENYFNYSKIKYFSCA